MASSSRGKRPTREDDLALVPSSSSVDRLPKRRNSSAIDAPVYRVLFSNGSHIRLRTKKSNAQDVINLLKRHLDEKPCDDINVNWGPHVYLEDSNGHRLEGRIPLSDNADLFLKDGQDNAVYALEDMWNVTPGPEILKSLPQEYTLETALADLLDNSLQAVWANSPGEIRLISVQLSPDKITIFDSGQGMDSSAENCIAKWGRIGSSNHRSTRHLAVGGQPPYLKPHFGMYGFGGLIAAMHIAGVAVVSSKTKFSRKVVSLTLEREKLEENCKADRTWKTPGQYREPTDEELRKSRHGSFTKVELSKLKKKDWDEDRVKCLLKDIYFPYIQCDLADCSQRTTTPVLFEVNDFNLAEVQGGEVALTNMASCVGEPFMINIHLEKKGNDHLQRDIVDMEDADPDINEANARISCFYFPIVKGKETIDNILEELSRSSIGINETFHNFSRVSVRRLGRLLPDARWKRLPFMEPKRKRGVKEGPPKICFERVKAVVETDAGFVPTTSKLDLLSEHIFTGTLRNFGTRGAMPDGIHFSVTRAGITMQLAEIEKKYEEWVMEMHQLFDQDVNDEEDKKIVRGPLEELGFSKEVCEVYFCTRRQGILWKPGMKIKFFKGVHTNYRDFYATFECILTDGFSEDKGKAEVICRPLSVSKDEGSSLHENEGIYVFELGKSVHFPIEYLSRDKCEIVDEQGWKSAVERYNLNSPGQIDVLGHQMLEMIGLQGISKEELQGVAKAKILAISDIYAVVRNNHYLKNTSLRKRSEPTDQRHIVKKIMKMRLDISSVDKDTCESSEFELTLVANERPCNMIHGLYWFTMTSDDCKRIFTTVGTYKFTFSLMDEDKTDPSMNEVFELTIVPSDTIQSVTLDGISETTCARLGSEIGPLFVGFCDEFGNPSFIDEPISFDFEISSKGKRLDIEVSVSELSYEQKRVTIECLKLEGGNLEGIANDYSASLKVIVNKVCTASIGLQVLPGEISYVEERRCQELGDCLRTGDIIHQFVLQAMDHWGNHVEKGCKIALDLDGIDLQDDQESIRTVDDNGCIGLGGLLKVVAPYNSEAQICVYSEDSILLYERKFHLLRRKLEIATKMPKECFAGSILEDIKVRIVDENGNLDRSMSGFVILSCYPDSAFHLEAGFCCVRLLKLPDQPGQFHILVQHSESKELTAECDINILPRMDLLEYNTESDPCNNPVALLLDESPEDKQSGHASHNSYNPAHDSTLLLLHDRQSLEAELINKARKFEQDITELQRLSEKHKKKAQSFEQELAKFQVRRNDRIVQIENTKEAICSLDDELSRFEKNQNETDEGDVGAERVAEEISRTNTPASYLMVSVCEGKVSSPDILGVTSMIGFTREKQLSKALAYLIGEDNMLSVICKTTAAARQIVRYNEIDGTIDDSYGLFKFIKNQKKTSRGKLRIYALEDMSVYMEQQDKHPQRLLKIPDPVTTAGVPDGFLGYAVNMLCLNKEHLSLRASLFYYFLEDAQVYLTSKQLIRARNCLGSIGISLDGGLIQCGNGFEDYGTWEEPRVIFPVYKRLQCVPTLHSINHRCERKRVGDVLQLKKKALQQLLKELEEINEKIRYLEYKVSHHNKKHQIYLEKLRKVNKEREMLVNQLSQISQDGYTVNAL